MKNLNKRTKRIVTIAGSIVVLALVVVLVFTQTQEGGLFGAAGTLTIAPANPIVYVDMNFPLTAKYPTITTGTWSVDNASILSGGGRTPTNSATNFKALAPGTAVVTFTLSNKTKVSTTVTVQPTTPMSITLAPDTGKMGTVIGEGERFTICSNEPTVRWSLETNPPNWSTLDHIELMASTQPGCTVVRGLKIGGENVRATDTNPATSDVVTTFEVYGEVTISPAYPTIKVGESVVLSNPYGETEKWTLSKCSGADCPVSLSASLGTSVTVTGLKTGYVIVIADPEAFYAGSWTGLTVVQVVP